MTTYALENEITLVDLRRRKIIERHKYESCQNFIEMWGDMQVKKDHNIEWFYASHKLDHSMAIVAIVWKGMHEFCCTMIIYSYEQKFD